MTIMMIVEDPNPILRQVSEPVDHIDDNLRILAGDMIDTMLARGAVGLAAVQVGRPIRLIVVRQQLEWIRAPVPGLQGPFLTMVNPVIDELSEDAETAVEGCLSLPGQQIAVARAAFCLVRFTDPWREGETTTRMRGLNARIVQHEIDHLDGKLMTDE